MNVVNPEALPLLLPIKQAVAVSGLSRSEIYLRLGTGELAAKKMRRSTMVLTASLLAMIEKLPKFGG
jgi:hypothetical protein